jgi:ferredoxin-NADP reductase/DMSO/TMAO reductase YedYZ heme-binding membrane subunit
MKPSQFVKDVVVVNCTVPAVLLAWDAWHGRLGANPVNFAIRTTGDLALIFLTLTLAVTPVSRLMHWSWLAPYRRIMGVCAFFHAALHFVIYFGLDRGGNVGDTLSEMVKRPYLTVGAVALVLMVPLAATSSDAMIRRLGGRRWKRLHRLAYAVAAAASLHFYMQVKADTSRPLAFAAVIGALFLYRVGSHYRRLLSDSRTLRSGGLAQAGGAPATAAPPKFWKGRLKVARVFDESTDVRTFRLTPIDGGPLPFVHLPGQYLNVSLDVDGTKLVRSYTIASPPSRGRYCEITVKREPHGAASRRLHEAVREGDLLDVSAPAGRFTFTGAEAPDVVLIAGGVGVTPIMAKVRYLTDVGWGGAIDFIYSVKTRRDLVFHEELEYLARRHPNLRITTVLSREDDPAWTGPRGRITPSLLTAAAPGIASRRVHLCGPTAMMDDVRNMLLDLGVPTERIHVESFVRPAAAPEAPREVRPSVQAATTPNGEPFDSPSVTFARSGRTTPVPPDESILEASERLGVGIPYDCRAGVCGQCKVQLLSGDVAMAASDALDPFDRAAGRILSCQARCLNEVVVDV